MYGYGLTILMVIVGGNAFTGIVPSKNITGLKITPGLHNINLATEATQFRNVNPVQFVNSIISEPPPQSNR